MNADPALSGLSLLHLIEPLLFFLLSLEWLQYLQPAKLCIALDRLDEYQAPLIEIILRFEGNLDRCAIGSGDLEEVLAIFKDATGHFTLSKVDEAAGG